MPLTQTIYDNSQLFHDLKAMGRDNFSYEGAKALQEYLEELSEDMGENIDYDPIAFCCDYAEYSESEYESLADEYNDAPKRDHFESDEAGEEGFYGVLKDWLQENTTVIEFNGGIIVQAF